MIRQDHEFSIDVFDSDGHLLGRSAVSPDWAPLAEHVHFSGIRRGILPPAMSQPPADVCPVWHADRGAPHVDGVRIEMSGPAGQQHGDSFPLDCFKAEAKRLSGEHVAAGTLKEGELFRYRVRAARRGPVAGPTGRMALLDVEEIEQPLVMTESSLQAFLDRSMSVGGNVGGNVGGTEGGGAGERLGQRSGMDDGVLPVFVAQDLVEQCVDLVRAAGDLETGGILIGRLHHDPSAGAEGIFLEITAQIPARHTDQAEMRVTFTDKTWAAARDALALRHSQESIVGWFHSHPDFCRKCPAEKREKCSLNGIFFSTADVSLHRTMFPRAWHVGLLFSNRPSGIIPALYGWDRGVVAAKPFHLLAPPNEVVDPLFRKTLGAVEAPILATVGGDEHGNTH